jgi:hypothetical protein
MASLASCECAFYFLVQSLIHIVLASIAMIFSTVFFTAHQLYWYIYDYERLGSLHPFGAILYD